MNARMAEATQLTRAGQLEEAMALLRGSIPMRAVVRALLPLTSSKDRQRRARRLSTWSHPSAERRVRGRQHALRSSLAAQRPTSGRTACAISWSASAAPTFPILRVVLGRLRFLLCRTARNSRSASTPTKLAARSYKLYVPSSYGDKPLPLIIMLHGCTQSPNDFAAGTRMNELAEEYDFLVAYPGQPSSANSSRCWNWFSVGDQLRGQGEPSLIAGITQQIIRDFRVEPESVFVAGLSAGGAAAAILGSAYPDLYAATGIHSGLACGAAKDVPSAFAAMRQGGSGLTASSPGQRPLRCIVFHGDRDKTVNPVNGDQVIAQSKGGAQLRAVVSRGQSAGGLKYTRSVHADESGRVMLEHWVLHGAGHAWSGGSAARSYTDPKGPDASREMVRFFLERPSAPS